MKGGARKRGSEGTIIISWSGIDHSLTIALIIVCIYFHIWSTPERIFCLIIHEEPNFKVDMIDEK